MKKIDEFHSDRKQNLAESDKGSWFNQLSESEAASASSLKIVYQQSEESNVTRERLPNESGLFFVVGFFLASLHF